MRYLVAVALAAIAAAPALAYTVYLNDGSAIVAKGEVVVKDGRAIITLPNGTKTSIPVEEIDRARTREVNEADYGDALLFDDGSARLLFEEKMKAPPKTKLADVAPSRPIVPESSFAPKEQATQSSTGLPKLASGASDLERFERRPPADLELNGYLRQLFSSRTVPVEVYQGTRSDRILLEFTTDSEATVFRALRAAAVGLLETQRTHPGKVAAFELFMSTEARQRAGQFLITPERATELAAGQLELATFFLRYVDF